MHASLCRQLNVHGSSAIVYSSVFLCWLVLVSSSATLGSIKFVGKAFKSLCKNFFFLFIYFFFASISFLLPFLSFHPPISPKKIFFPLALRVCKISLLPTSNAGVLGHFVRPCMQHSVPTETQELHEKGSAVIENEYGFSRFVPQYPNLNSFLSWMWYEAWLRQPPKYWTL